MRLWRAVIAGVTMAMARAIHSDLTEQSRNRIEILHPPSMRTALHTVGFKYYGPATAVLLNATAYYMTGAEACQQSPLLSGLVIFVVDFAPCGVEGVYEHLNARQAAALVSLNIWPEPGIGAYRHEHVFTCDNCASALVNTDLPAYSQLPSGESLVTGESDTFKIVAKILT